MSFLEALVPFILILGLLAFYRANGYYAEDFSPAATAPLACNGTSKASPPPPPATALCRPAAAPSPRTPNTWRNTYSTDKESIDGLLSWMNQRFLEGGDDDDDL